MAKFDKDIFLSDMTDKVKDAIESGLISQKDIDDNDVERLIGFLQYALSDYIEDRKKAIDILRDFNYDERYSWESLEEQIGGKFKSLFDIALANLWKFLEASGLLTYAYYVEGVSPKNSKKDITIDYDESEFDDDKELEGEIKDEDFEEDEFEEDEEVKEKINYDIDDYLDLEDENDDMEYQDMLRKRRLSRKRNFKNN